MTINLSDNSPRVSYNVAAGVTQTSFTVSFEFFDNDDLNVYVDGVLKTLTTDYSVSGGDGSTGTITMSVTGASGGSTVVITRDIDLDRTTDFPSSGPFNIASLNTELDRFVAIAADLKDQADRSLQLTDFDVAASITLPEVDDRKGKTLAFNSTSGAVQAGPTISDVQSVSAAAADIQTLAHIEDGTDATDTIQTVAGIASNVSTVAGVSSAVSTVAGISSDVTSVAGDASDIGTVATNIADVNTAATNITEIQNAPTNAATATTKAAEAATSASNAATSETNAATSATTATTKASEASTSATNAATSETNAGNSATAAATSETNAATSETNAANSAAAAATALDNFDDRYLGSKTSDPTVDNDGNALVSGALYFNSTANEMRVYDGANWIAASSAGTASLILYEYTATSGQTTFSGADDNSASLSYSVGNIQVVMNGVVLDPSDFTATSGTSVVLASGAATDDLVNIYAFKSFTVADTVSASAGGTFAGDVNFTGAFTSKGIDDNATSTAMTLDASGRLLHGKTTAGDYVTGTEIQPAGAILSYRTGGVAAIHGRTDDGEIIRLTSNSSIVGNIGATSGDLYIGEGDTGLKFDAEFEAIVPFNTSTLANRDQSIDLGASNPRFRDLYLSGGVYLGGTGSANKLEDYEEGTWTPSFTNLTIGNGSVFGTYTKIGRSVTIVFGFNCGSTTSVGTLGDITGIPFTASNDYTGFIKVHGVAFDSGSRWHEAVAVIGNNSSSVLVPSTTNYNSSISSTNPMTWTTNDTLVFTATYTTS